MITAKIIADSINEYGCRLTSFILEYPRFVHAEFMTHRMFSKNAASSRAIPIEKMIQQIIDNPAMPVWWGKNQSGMSAREELDNTNVIYRAEVDRHLTDLEYAKEQWLYSRDKAIGSARALNKLGLHKQITNRILEPWFNIRIIVTATDFENFFALRVHEDAQPEIRELATVMLKEYNESTPKKLKVGEWHIPFGDSINEDKLKEMNTDVFCGLKIDLPINRIDVLKRKIAIARCARVSYFNHEGKDDYDADVKLCDRLFGSIPRHLSPTEHVAQAMGNTDYIANFRGFKQYRYLFTDQNLTDSRVIKK